MTTTPPPEPQIIAVRGYTELPRKRQRRGRPSSASTGPSDWVLVFDTETTTDHAQQLRFDVYQLRKSGVLKEQGFFYDPLSLTEEEQSILHAYASRQGVAVRTLRDFADDVFLPYMGELNGLCIAFNLPFDLSRIAMRHTAGGKRMRGAFSFQLSQDPGLPRIQVRHLDSRSSLIRFTAGRRQRTPRGMRNRDLRVPVQRGHFVDVRELAGAVLGGSWSLQALAKHLGTEHQKLDTDEHGGPLTEDYLEYAENDVQVTWECFECLRDEYNRYGLTHTLIDQIHSEASLGKAQLRQMGVRPWRELQPNVRPELLGIIMSSYYGGRSEVHIRREVVRVVYCDFLSMYPTVCTLMGLWRFVRAERMAWHSATREVRALVSRLTMEDLQNPETWTNLTVLVQVEADGDLLPVRSPYGDDGQRTIGLNYLTCKDPLWFTLADVIAAKELIGKTPRILRALHFTPIGVQEGLQPVTVAGDPRYHIDPATEDFYRRLIDLRQEIKVERSVAEEAGDAERATVLDAEQRALKVRASATSYGIFVELNVQEYDRLREVRCYGPKRAPFPTWVKNIEKPGRYFHPLLGTFITGAARLMLALAERLAEDAGISWAFCDTDSMAFAKPEGMTDDRFVEAVEAVRSWFRDLNPYERKGDLLKIEDANYRLETDKRTLDLEPLYCFAMSAKRHALFNVDREGRPVLRKASAHGLGHLLPPYPERRAPRSIPKPAVPLQELEVERWQYDLWYRIVEAALQGRPERVRLDDLPGYDRPVVSRYAATTPALLSWFDRFNRDKPYRDRVKPFNFLLAFQPDRMNDWSGEERMELAEQADLRRFYRERWADVRGRILPEGGIQPTAEFGEDAVPRALRRTRGLPADVMASLFGYDYTDDFLKYVRSSRDRYVDSQRKRRRAGMSCHPVAPYESDPKIALACCFDRETGESVAAHLLKTYGQVLARYHLRPEAKFHNGDWLDSGVTTRRHIEAIEVEHIGKEANRWQEQFFLGLDPDAQIEYGMTQEDVDRLIQDVLQACRDYDVRKVAERAGLDPTGLSRLLRGQTRPRPSTLSQLRVAAEALAMERQEYEVRVQAVLDAVRAECQQMSVRRFAAKVGIDSGYLSRVLVGRGKANQRLLGALERAVRTTS